LRILVTGSAGHLGEGLVRTIRNSGNEAVGTDLLHSQFTDMVGSIVDRDFVSQCIDGIDAVIHTATLHKPHVASHSRQAFIDSNITGTLNLLEAAAAARLRRFVFTSTTSVFGDVLTPPAGAPAIWITEDVEPVPKNIYGVTKAAAEDLCQLFHRNHGLSCLVLRTSRFFPEEDDSAAIRESFAGDNAKANEFLFRRVDLEDAVSAHLCAVERAPEIGFGRYIISATTPLARQDLADLRTDAADVVGRRVARYEAVYRRRGWRMFAAIDRVYVNKKARDELGWRPVYDFGKIVDQLDGGESMGSELARQVGIKGYHAGPS
jgi:nucleoside-diphosphate-sugar epimerase|tara:strand:+ start:609 stop:1568 length:960 start_codon:yes stop_codon:yes gene_type:complete